MEPAITRATTVESSQHERPPPDSGLEAWTQAFIGHLTLFNAWGYINSYGAFQTYYQTELGISASEVSWVGSVQTFIVFLFGILAGRAADAGYFWQTFGTGCVLQLIGVFMTSLAKTYWQQFLAQALCTGIGSGLTFCPVVAVVATYFSKCQTLALSITASGGAVGGIVFPLIVEQLLPKVGFSWTLRVFGLVMLGNTIIIIMFLRPRSLPGRGGGPLVDWSSFKELPYTLFTIGFFFAFWGLYFAFYYVRIS